MILSVRISSRCNVTFRCIMEVEVNEDWYYSLRKEDREEELNKLIIENIFEQEYVSFNYDDLPEDQPTGEKDQ